MAATTMTDLINNGENAIHVVNVGDYLLIDGYTFRIDADRGANVNIKLTPAEPPTPDYVNREQTLAERRLPNC